MTSKTPALSIEKLKRHFLECLICKEQYDDEEKHPRVLPCLHSFCYSCLRRLIEQTKYTCPLCNLNFKTENMTPDIFPKDNTRRDLSDFVHAADKNTFLACDECDVNEKSIARCKDCFKFLGANCLKAHKTMKTFAKHKVFDLRDVTLDINSLSDFRSAGICSHHHELLNLYCAGKECQVPICHSCCLTSHMDDKTHVRRNIDDVYNEKKKDLLEKEIKLEDVANELNHLSSKIEQTLEYLDENSNMVESEINAIFQTAIEMLQRRKTHLLEEVKEIKKDKEIVLQKQVAEIGFLTHNIHDACEFLNQSLASENQAAFLILSKTIAERFDYLLNTDFDEVPHDDSLINFQKRNFGDYFKCIVNMLSGVASTTAFSRNTERDFSQTIKKDDEFEIEIYFYDFTNSQIQENIKVTYTLFDEKGTKIKDCEDKHMIEDDRGKHNTSCMIADDADNISKICIKVYGKDSYCINIDTLITDGKENNAHDKKNSDTEQDMKIGVIFNSNEYAGSQDGKEDTQTGHAEDDTDSDDRKEDTMTENLKQGLVNEDGKKDTLIDEQAKPVSTSENGKEDELSDYREKEKVTMQIHNEEQSMYTEKTFILLFDHIFLKVR
ncbi:unnamed protein product [Mytilus coruscus]|uniref:RING-type domain-containing protein n=1 Tax=Mytilus coruscus TaxID=42192 RepID=A0A6J8E440_MYTCO|nr:unnamed protein product [Mytilus coruscus]